MFTYSEAENTDSLLSGIDGTDQINLDIDTPMKGYGSIGGEFSMQIMGDAVEEKSTGIDMIRTTSSETPVDVRTGDESAITSVGAVQRYKLQPPIIGRGAIVAPPRLDWDRGAQDVGGLQRILHYGLTIIPILTNGTDCQMLISPLQQLKANLLAHSDKNARDKHAELLFQGADETALLDVVSSEWLHKDVEDLLHWLYGSYRKP